MIREGKNGKENDGMIRIDVLPGALTSKSELEAKTWL